MKLVKNFVKTCYSEVLVSESSNTADNEREDGSLIPDEKDGTTQDVTYHGGLGLKFKFPGDPKKYASILLAFISNEADIFMPIQTARSLKNQAMDNISAKWVF
jgi:hypothetical protein